MNCKEATEASIRKTDGKIGLGERIQLWMHLLACKYCTLFSKQQEWLNKSLSKYSDQNANFSAEEKDTMNQQLKNL